MSNAAKKREDEIAERPDLGSEREIGLAKNFEDPALEHILLDAGEAQVAIPSPGDPAGILHETADALQELMSSRPAEEISHATVAVDIPSDLAAGGSSSALELGLPESPGLYGSVEAAGTVDPSFSDLSFAAPSAGGAGELPSTPELPGAYTAASEFIPDVPTAEEIRWKMGEKLFDLVVCDLSFDQLVHQILAILVEGMGAEAGSILEVDSTTSEFFFRASVGGGHPDQLKAFRIPQFKGIVGRVAESRQSLLLRDLEADEMQLKAISMGTGFETRTCIASPMVVAGQLYGVIELFNTHSGESFSIQDVATLERTVHMAVKVLEVRFVMAELARRVG